MSTSAYIVFIETICHKYSSTDVSKAIQALSCPAISVHPVTGVLGPATRSHVQTVRVSGS